MIQLHNGNNCWGILKLENSVVKYRHPNLEKLKADSWKSQLKLICQWPCSMEKEIGSWVPEIVYPHTVFMLLWGTPETRINGYILLIFIITAEEKKKKWILLCIYWYLKIYSYTVNSKRGIEALTGLFIYSYMWDPRKISNWFYFCPALDL